MFQINIILTHLNADYSQGFGGKYGVQKDRVDQSAKGWSESQKVEAHASQVDHKKVSRVLTQEGHAAAFGF